MSRGAIGQLFERKHAVNEGLGENPNSLVGVDFERALEGKGIILKRAGDEFDSAVSEYVNGELEATANELRVTDFDSGALVDAVNAAGYEFVLGQ